MCTKMCTKGGRRKKTWGLTESLVDKPGDSKIPLDLVFHVRESVHSYRAAHANRGRETEPNGVHLRVSSGRRRTWFTRRKRVRTEREAIAPGTESPVRRRPRARTYRSRPKEHPNCSGRRGRRRPIVDTGNRVSVNGVERPRGRFCRSPSLDSGSGGRFAGHRGRGGTAAGEPVARPECDEVGQPAHRALASVRRPVRRSSCGVAASIGRPMVGVERQRARATGSTAGKRASPAEPFGTTGDVMIETKANARRSIDGGSLHPLGSPGGCAGFGWLRHPGPLSFSARFGGRVRAPR